MIKYLGSKRLLLPYIEGTVAALPAARSVCDLFAGTTRVGQALKRMALFVISNDTAAYSEVFGRCYIEADADAVDHSEVAGLLDQLASLPPRAGYFTETFCVRSRFFQPENGMRIDAIRDGIDEMHLEEPMRSIVLTSLIEAADRVDSTTGLQMAYLKEWAPRSYQDLELRVPEMTAGTGEVHCEDANELVRRLPEVDLLYLDPPYNQHSYFSNYHIWETLVRNDSPPVYGKACKRVDCRTAKSPYNSRTVCFEALADIVRRARARYLLVSFNDEGFVSRGELEEVLSERGEVLRLLEEAEFSEAIKGSDRARIEEVLRRYPGSAFSERALARVDQIDFEKARTEALNEPSTVPLRRYLDAHSKGKYVTVAQALIEEIDQHYTAYMDRLERARGAGDLAIFSKWLTDNPGNHYAARRGRDDLDALRREVAIEDLVEDLTTTQTERARRTVPAARARALNKYARAIAYVESNTGGSTGFLFRGGGLLVTNARMLHNADLTRVSAKLGGRSYVCRVVSVADRQGPDVAVLRIEETFDPIPLGNSAVLDGGEKVTCLSARDSKTVHSEGTFIETRTAGGNEWLIISSTKIPVDLGGVVLNSRAEAVGLLVRSEQVDPAVKEDAPDRVYALSLRSALPHMKKALSE